VIVDHSSKPKSAKHITCLNNYSFPHFAPIIHTLYHLHICTRFAVFGYISLVECTRFAVFGYINWVKCTRFAIFGYINYSCTDSILSAWSSLRTL
jgi:hypothetical protein